MEDGVNASKLTQSKVLERRNGIESGKLVREWNTVATSFGRELLLECNVQTTISD